MAPVMERTRPAIAASSPRARSGAAALGRFELFRYEIRRWRGGRIPDIAEAVDSPQRLSDGPRRRAPRARARRRACRRRCGAATSCTPARCGTPTRSSPGCSPERNRLQQAHIPAGGPRARLDGRPQDRATRDADGAERLERRTIARTGYQLRAQRRGARPVGVALSKIAQSANRAAVIDRLALPMQDQRPTPAA